jgi:hypothetical protein
VPLVNLINRLYFWQEDTSEQGREEYEAARRTLRAHAVSGRVVAWCRRGRLGTDAVRDYEEEREKAAARLGPEEMAYWTAGNAGTFRHSQWMLTRAALTGMLRANSDMSIDMPE